MDSLGKNQRTKCFATRKVQTAASASRDLKVGVQADCLQLSWPHSLWKVWLFPVSLAEPLAVWHLAPDCWNI